MIESVIINQSELFYETKWDYGNLNEYYQFILNKIKSFLMDNNVHASVNFGCNELVKDINLGFQYEHTIIKGYNGEYECLINDFDNLIKCDFVFEYSNANINHIKKYSEFNEYLKVGRYFPPLIYDITKSHKRTHNCLTIHNITPRRHEIHQQVDIQYYHHECGNDPYGKENMKEIMDKFKVLINIHQTDNHHTLEELRVLPALMTGILIISEDVPYKESIPYSQHIVWSSFEELPHVINDVLKNYNEYCEKYLKGVDKTLIKMINHSDEVLKLIFKNFIR